MAKNSRSLLFLLIALTLLLTAGCGGKKAAPADMQGVWDLRKQFMTEVVNRHAGDLVTVGTIHQIALEIAAVMAANYIGHVKNEMDAIYCFLANIFSDKIVCPMSWTSYDSTEALKSYIGPYWEVDIKIC